MWLLTSPFLVTCVCSVSLVFSLQSSVFSQSEPNRTFPRHSCVFSQSSLQSSVFSLQSVRTEQNNLTSLADPNWPITTDLCHLSLTANYITAKLTNQCTQTGLSTFDWQQPFTWLWWWLPLRLSKRQSPLPTTVHLRTTLTQTIKLHYYMLPLGSNLLL